MKSAVVVGAGPVGSLLTLCLAQRGYQVDVYERRSDMRAADAPAGRSINLACSTRGWHALDQVGIGDRCRERAIAMPGRMIHAQDGALSFQPYGSEGQAIFAIHRAELNRILLEAAGEQPAVRLHFNERCTGLDAQSGGLELTHAVTGEIREVTSDLIFGADGAFSAVRKALQHRDRFDYSQDYLKHGYKELTIPATEAGGFAIERDALHIWPRGQYMLIALPNMDGSFTCTLFLPFEGAPSFATLTTPAAVEAFFEEVFPDALAVMPTLTKDFFVNPTSSLCIIRCYPWNHEERVTLIGDAAHAIVPFYGQGMIAGFEDCSVLCDCLDELGEDWSRVLAEFQQRRKPNADAIAELALQNFVEMRDHVGDPRFLLRKEVERRLHEQWPGAFSPLYSQVTFSRIPYAEALAAGRRQDVLLTEIMAAPGIQGATRGEGFVELVEPIFKRWKASLAEEEARAT